MGDTRNRKGRLGLFIYFIDVVYLKFMSVKGVLLFGHCKVVKLPTLEVAHRTHLRSSLFLSTMDLIENIGSLTPLPHLSANFVIFRYIWQTVQQVQGSQEQLRELVRTIAQLLQTLDREYRAARLSEGGTSAPLEDLHKYVKIQTRPDVPSQSYLISQATQRDFRFRFKGSHSIFSRFTSHQR